MAVTVSLAGVQSSTGVDAAAHRRALVAPLAHTSGAQPRAGILPTVGGGLAVTPGSGLSVNVASGAIVIPAPNAAQGGYTVYNDGVLGLGLAAASASNPRIDLLIARVADPFYYSGGDGQPAIKVITGSAASSPTIPPIPSTEGAYVVLKQIAVPANATALTAGQITDYATPVTNTAAAGGVLRVQTTAQRDAALTSGAVYPGMSVWVDAVKEEHKLALDPSTGATRWLRNKAWALFTPAVLRSPLGSYNNNPLAWSTARGWYGIADGMVHGSVTLVTAGYNDPNDGGWNLRFTPPVAASSSLSYGNVAAGEWVAYDTDVATPAQERYVFGFTDQDRTSVDTTDAWSGSLRISGGAIYFSYDAAGKAVAQAANLKWFQSLNIGTTRYPNVTASFHYPVD